MDCETVWEVVVNIKDKNQASDLKEDEGFVTERPDGTLVLRYYVTGDTAGEAEKTAIGWFAPIKCVYINSMKRLGLVAIDRE